jgi:DNA (cytosine-5)-methyltransferase 1
MIVDLFAGPGGWSEGLRRISPELHATEIGIEWDEHACLTRAAAGHKTIRADIATYAIDRFKGKTLGLIASPPCQDFSTAGTKAGLKSVRAQLINQVPRWITTLDPEWVACEQVPQALPFWEMFAEDLRQAGYGTWTGIINAADFGVPQTRRRAFLMAHKNRKLAAPPEATHDQDPQPTLFGESKLPWVTMKDAIGHLLKPDHWTVNSGCSFTVKGDRETAYHFDGASSPAATLTGQAPSQWQIGRIDGAGIKLTEEAALILQSFPCDYPMVGSKSQRSQQIGNAVPPTVAAHVLARLLNLSIERLAPLTMV